MGDEKADVMGDGFAVITANIAADHALALEARRVPEDVAKAMTLEFHRQMVAATLDAMDFEHWMAALGLPRTTDADRQDG